MKVVRLHGCNKLRLNDEPDPIPGVSEVDVIPIDAPLPKLQVACASWVPRPDLKTAAKAWILAGGAHQQALA